MRLSPQWGVGAEIGWQNWSALKSFPQQFEATANSPLSQSLLDTPGSLTMRDTYSCSIGAQYWVSERMAISGSVYYSTSAFSDPYFSAFIPDAPVRALTVGFSYNWTKTTLDFTYSYTFYQDRTITSSTQYPDNLLGATALGNYSQRAQILQLSLTRRF